MIYIESKDNNTYKNLKKLKEKKYRNKEKKYIIEGFRLIEEAFKASLPVLSIIINSNAKEKLESYLGKFINSEVKIYEISDNLFKELSSTENSQGIIAVISMNNNTEDINSDFYLLCDKIQDPGNLGTIIRTAHAAGAGGVILTKGTVDVYNDKAIRSTMGSIFYMPIIYDNDLSFVNKLKNDGFKLVATSLEESMNFFEEDLTGKIILTVGNEGNGVTEEIFNLADKKVKIPMPGGAESLNVSVASSIILFERVRQSLIK